MASPVNDRDVLIMNASPRFTPPTDRGMFISPPAALFKVSADGSTASPASFTFQVTLLNMTGAVTFSFSNGMTPTVSGNTVTLSYANMSAVSGTITANITVDGLQYTAIATVSKVADGAAGVNGIRGNVDIAAVTNGSVWSDSEAVAALAAAGYGAPQVRDMVTLYKSDRTFGSQKMYNGSAWVAVDYVWNGNVFVKGSILPEAIDTRGLTIKDAQGNVILGSGTGLPTAYAAPGTLNSDLTPAINSAASTAYWPNVTGPGLPENGATVGANASNFTGTLGGDNLLNNSGFEVVDGTYRPYGYGVYNNGGTASATYLNAGGRTGGRAFGLHANSTSNTTFGLYSSNTITDGSVNGGVQGGWQPNKTYIVSFKARKVNGANMSTMFLQWNTPPATTTWVNRPTLSTGWQVYTARITWGASVEGAGQLFIDSIAGATVVAGDEIYIDELIVQEGDIYSEWFPSSREAKTTADSAMTALAVIASDSKLSVGEKPAVEKEWDAIYNERGPLVTQASNLGVDSTAYTAKFNTLQSYLAGITGWGDRVTDSPIDPNTFKTNFTNYYVERANLVNALAAKASTMANWGAVAGRPSHCRVVAAGGSAGGYNIGPGFYVESTSSATYGAGRSYNLVVIRRSDRAVIYNNTFDVYGDINQAYNLRNVLNGYGSDVIVVVYTADEPLNNHFESTLAAAMYRCGASKAIYGSPQFQYRSAYILVGIPGVGEGGGAEAYQGSVGSDPNAWCDIGLTIDNLGNYQVSANYTPRSLADYGYSGDYNATNGATIGSNLFGQMNASNISTYIAAAAINLALINKASIGSLSALSAVIGTLRTATSGARTEISDNVIKVFDTSNQLRVRLGDLSL